MGFTYDVILKSRSGAGPRSHSEQCKRTGDPGLDIQAAVRLTQQRCCTLPESFKYISAHKGELTHREMQEGGNGSLRSDSQKAMDAAMQTPSLQSNG